MVISTQKDEQTNFVVGINNAQVKNKNYKGGENGRVTKNVYYSE